MAVISGVSLVAWLLLLVMPWRSWMNGEVLEDEVTVKHLTEHPDLTILIPARNESKVILKNLAAINAQGLSIPVMVVDDNSTDGTGDLVRSGFPQVEVLTAAPKPQGWSGKLWALHSGLQRVKTSAVLLLDADIMLEAGALVSMLQLKQSRQLQLVSIMALLRNKSLWEKLLIPAFVFFFKQLYPFRLSNSSFPYVAAAAGGCILVDTEVLRESGGFEQIKGEIIDDCSLAKQIKRSGHGTWIGLSRQVLSHRSYETLDSIWAMVERTAFSQLRYSTMLLLICTLVMLVCFWGPVFSLLDSDARIMGSLALVCMMISYLPTLNFYRQGFIWALALPVVAGIYLGMTWSSALKHWFGQGVEWKDRQYSRYPGVRPKSDCNK